MNSSRELNPSSLWLAEMLKVRAQRYQPFDLHAFQARHTSVDHRFYIVLGSDALRIDDGHLFEFTKRLQ
jgi:hypothetical protein